MDQFNQRLDLVVIVIYFLLLIVIGFFLCRFHSCIINLYGSGYQNSCWFVGINTISGASVAIRSGWNGAIINIGITLAVLLGLISKKTPALKALFIVGCGILFSLLDLFFQQLRERVHLKDEIWDQNDLGHSKIIGRFRFAVRTLFSSFSALPNSLTEPFLILKFFSSTLHISFLMTIAESQTRKT